MVGTKKTNKTKKAQTSGRRPTVLEVQDLLLECRIDRLSDNLSENKKIYEMIGGALGEYSIDTKPAFESKKKLAMATKKMAATKHFASELSKHLINLDDQIVDALYDPFYENNSVLQEILKLAIEFGAEGQLTATTDQQSEFFKKLHTSPGLAFRDVLVGLLKALFDGAERFEHFNRCSEKRGKLSHLPEHHLINVLFSIYDYAYHGLSENGLDDWDDEATDITRVEYDEYKALFANKILMLAAIPSPGLGEIGHDSRSPSRLVKLAKKHSKNNNGIASLGFNDFWGFGTEEPYPP